MESQFRHRAKPALQALFVLLAASLGLPRGVLAECREFRIVEYEDRVEAVCVGEPLTEAQKKSYQEEEKRQEQEAHRKRSEESRIQQEAAMAVKLKEETERKRQTKPPPASQQPANRNTGTNPTTTNPQIMFR